MSKETRKVYKVSPTLLNSYLNMKNKTYENSYESFINTLKRIPLEENYFLKRGNDFEERVTKLRSEPFNKIVRECKTQYFVEKDIDFKDEDFDIKMLGFIDFISKDKKIIYDTKRVNSWNDDKYDISVQHDFYLWAVPESEVFYYLVGEGKGWVADNYFQVEYAKLPEEELEAEFRKIITEFLAYLKENDLLEIYKKNYFSKPRKKTSTRGILGSSKKEDKDNV